MTPDDIETIEATPAEHAILDRLDALIAMIKNGGHVKAKNPMGEILKDMGLDEPGGIQAAIKDVVAGKEDLDLIKQGMATAGGNMVKISAQITRLQASVVESDKLRAAYLLGRDGKWKEADALFESATKPKA